MDETQKQLRLSKESVGKVSTGYPSIDKPWLKYYNTKCSCDDIPKGSMYDYVWESNKDWLDRPMLRYFGSNISGRSFFENIWALAYSFQSKGLKRGDTVTLMSLITPETVYCIYALNYLGVTVNSVYLEMSEREIVETIERTNSKMLIILELIVDKIKAIEGLIKLEQILVLSISDSLSPIKSFLYKLKTHKSVLSNNMMSYAAFVKSSIDKKPLKADADDNTIALIVYTSGSTGTPKGVALTNYNINSTAVNYLNAKIQYEKTDVYLTFIPLFLSIGVSFAMHYPLVAGMTLDIFPDPAPNAVCKHFLKVRPNHFVGDPHNAVMIAEKTKGNLEFLKTMGCGGGSPTSEQEKQVNEILAQKGSKSKLLTGYGMTELASSAITNLNHIHKENSLGIPLPLNNIKIVNADSGEEVRYNEEGELWISSPGQTSGYVNDEEANKELFAVDDKGTEWVKTGDLALVDEDGFVFFKGRMKRIFLKTGSDGTPYKIFPQRVEELLQDSQLISECAVVVLDDKELQHIQIAYVSGIDVKDEVVDELKHLCIDNLPEFMVPEKIEVLDEIPRLPNGKVDYQKLEKITQAVPR